MQLKLQENQNYEHLYSDEVDIGNSLSSLKPIDEENTSDVFQIISSLSPTNIYDSMDVFSRVIYYLNIYILK